MAHFAQGLFVSLVLAAGSMAAAAAADFPTKPIRVIVPYAAGGIVDAVARAVGSQLAETIGQPVIVENRSGGSAIIGMMACAKAPADGYALCMPGTDAVSYNAYLFKNLPYDSARDFVPVINLFLSNSMLAAKANAPFNSFKEMIAYAKSNAGALNWATWGAASLPDVYLRWIKHQAGVDIAAIAYKGVAPSMQALLAGESDITFMAIGMALPHIRSGKLKALAVVGAARSAHLPETPSLAEEGADPGLRSYFGVFAPARTPKAIIDRLNAEFAKAIQTPRIREFTRAQILDAAGDSATDFAEFLKRDRDNAGRVYRAIGVRPADAPS